MAQSQFWLALLNSSGVNIYFEPARTNLIEIADRLLELANRQPQAPVIVNQLRQEISDHIHFFLEHLNLVNNIDELIIYCRDHKAVLREDHRRYTLYLRLPHSELDYMLDDLKVITSNLKWFASISPPHSSQAEDCEE